MCGIFGIISKNTISSKDFKKLALLSRERGKDSSGFLKYDGNYSIEKFDKDIKHTIDKVIISNTNLIIGHSRLITDSTPDNQPILSEGIAVVHNGIIVNHQEVFDKYNLNRKLKIDTEIIPILIDYYLNKNFDLEQIIELLPKDCKGIMSCAVAIPRLGKLLLFSNNGSLYCGLKNNNYHFASDKYFLKKLNCTEISQVQKKILDIPLDNRIISQKDESKKRNDIVPSLTSHTQKENLLINKRYDLKRCTKCVLPSTMPFIKFDNFGICNYCNNYQKRNVVKYTSDQINLILDKYRNSKGEVDCIVPLSGGRDSCYSLHLAIKELNLNPITYTYDWGLVTDLARRNISRMCSNLNVENIIFADDITKKRNFIKKNVQAWLKKPHLGMVNLFTAGDKHFFRHVETVKKRRGIKLDLWGDNPYEITHFKSGFLGLKPEFAAKKVYVTGLKKQVSYHSKRTYQMIRNPGYLNMSIFDNLYGEFYRSLNKRTNHYSIFDFKRWDEEEVEKILELYEWEKSVDTKSTWRIGDGAAAFYNYIYQTLVGFSEYDTFRSNQIREGDISRNKAIELIESENSPRYQNIKWFLEIIDLDFDKTINRINEFSYDKNSKSI